jgi:hypothetical protein
MRVLRGLMIRQDVTRVSESGARPVLRARGERLPAPARLSGAGSGASENRGGAPRLIATQVATQIATQRATRAVVSHATRVRLNGLSLNEFS